MGQGQTSEDPRQFVTREAFLARFDRVSSGLDPDQVYALFKRAAAHTEQLEEQAKRASPPAIVETTLREAAELCARATELAEQAFERIVAEAKHEAEQIRAVARREGEAIVAEARREAAELRRIAAEYVRLAQAMLDETRHYADGVGQPDSGATQPSTLSPSTDQSVGLGGTNATLRAETPSAPQSAPGVTDLASLAAALGSPVSPPAPVEAPPSTGDEPGTLPPDRRPAQPARFEPPAWLES